MKNNEETLPEETLELEPGDENLDPQGNDPFDLIEDEGVRNEAKKFRAIANRKDKKPTVSIKKEEPKVVIPDTSDFVKKSDVARKAVNEAKELVSEEIRNNWDELIKIPLAGYDNLDAKSIAKNMAERLVIFKARTPAIEPKPDTTDLTKTAVTPTAGGGDSKETPKKDPPNFSLPKGPADWYK